MMKKLMKSDDRRICGVCGGFAEYFNVDPTVVRCITAITALFCEPIIVMYFIAALIIPSNEK
jgi:phage shock protein PspC (stress-responsive transcriptional regulator)